MTTSTPDLSQAKVFDVADPDRYGKIIGAGSQQSEVRFDDGAVRIVPNDHLRAVDHELDNPTHVEEPPENAAIRHGQEAWCRLRAGSTWADWVAVGTAHVIGRTTAMRDSHINKPKGRSYNAAFSAWQKKFGFEGLDKGDRARLFDVMDHLKEIDGWLQKLQENERLRLNHPSSIWRRWKAATATPKADTDPKPSPMQKLKDELVTVIEERDRYKREVERGGGDLWTPQDRPKDIARIIIAKVGVSKALSIIDEIRKAVKAKETATNTRSVRSAGKTAPPTRVAS